MHFAFAITEYFPFGGAQREFFAAASAMAKRGHQISVITTGWQGEQPPEWQYFIMQQKTKTNHGRMRELSDYVLQLKGQQQFDAVIGFTRMVGLDVYYCVDNSYVATRYKGLKRLLPRYRTFAQIERAVFANKKLKTFFMTEKQRSEYQTCYQLNTAESEILPVCVDSSFKYDVQKWRLARQWRQSYSKSPIVLLFVAADFKTKGLDRIIDAFRRLSESAQQKFALWVVGDGKPEQYQDSIKQLLKIEVKFWGGQSDVGQFYLAADYLVHPARIESAGMVIAEAMAAKLPILVTDVCGYSFLADDDDASIILHDQQVVSELTEALQHLTESSVVPERGMGSKQLSYSSRAEFCVDKIEQWCGQ